MMHNPDTGVPSPGTRAENVVIPVAPYRTVNQVVRGLIAAILMGTWAICLASGIYLIRPDTRSLSGILTVLCVPILLVSALPLVYRYWVKNWRTM